MRIEQDFSVGPELGRVYDLLAEDGRHIMRVGLILFNLLAQRYAIWIELVDFRLSDLRRARKFFQETAQDAELFCNVAKVRPEAVRFAEFFGFEVVADARDVLVMEYVKCKQPR